MQKKKKKHNLFSVKFFPEQMCKSLSVQTDTNKQITKRDLYQNILTYKRSASFSLTNFNSNPSGLQIFSKSVQLNFCRFLSGTQYPITYLSHMFFFPRFRAFTSRSSDHSIVLRQQQSAAFRAVLLKT